MMDEFKKLMGAKWDHEKGDLDPISFSNFSIPDSGRIYRNYSIISRKNNFIMKIEKFYLFIHIQKLMGTKWSLIENLSLYKVPFN